MWAPINTSAILQSAKAEIWKQCCTVLLETYSMAPCNIFIQTKSLAHKAVVRKVKVFNTRQRATNLYLKTNHILPVINEILGIGDISFLTPRKQCYFFFSFEHPVCFKMHTSFQTELAVLKILQ